MRRRIWCISHEAPRPIDDPLLGIAVEAPDFPVRHRLVTIGDSLTHGFRSLAINDTENSVPGGAGARARRYERASATGRRTEGHGGLPLNLEWLFRDAAGTTFGAVVSACGELPLALFRRSPAARRSEEYWERGRGSQIPPTRPGIDHNLGDLRLGPARRALPQRGR